jgi:hypothetical protein
MTNKTILSEKKIHRAGRVDQIVRDWFIRHSTATEVLAKNLMEEFISKGIFRKDYKNGLPIRSFLRELDAVNKLNLLKHCKVIRKAINRNWYFAR